MKLPELSIISCFFLSIIGTSYSANILFYFGVASYSHRIAVWPLVEELAERGHKTTFLSGYPPKKPNPKVSEIVPKALGVLLENEENNVLTNRLKGTIQGDWEVLPFFGKVVCETVLKSPDVKEWIKTAKFDLVIIDGLFNECGLGLAYLFKAKIISVSTSSIFMWTYDMIGNVPETSTIPEMNYFYETPMTFLERVHNTIIPLYWHFWIRHINYLPEMEQLLREELSIPDMPKIKEIEKNTSLAFLTTHYSIEYARSLPPIFVPIAGLHIEELKINSTLPQEFAKFVDESGPDGVIYLSFGSAAKASQLPPEIKSVFLEVLANFKSTRFIWKFDIDQPKDFPENIMAAKWVPQQELLAHKKLKAFITHGGLGSIQEATFYGVPLIIFPLFAEQDYNANLIHKSGCGIKLEIIGITKEKFHDAISEIMTDKRYKTRMAERSALFKDRPAKPLETAVWWTEYVLRHDDVSSLRPLSVHQTWYERRLLDIWFFLFSLLLLSIFTLIYIISKCLVLFKGQSNPKGNKFKKY